MAERTVEAIYISRNDWFEGTIDDEATISVCGKRYIVRPCGGIEYDFRDRKGKERSIGDVLVDEEDFEKIKEGLEVNGYELVGPIGKGRFKENERRGGNPPQKRVAHSETLVVYDSRYPEEGIHSAN